MNSQTLIVVSDPGSTDHNHVHMNSSFSTGKSDSASDQDLQCCIVLICKDNGLTASPFAANTTKPPTTDLRSVELSKMERWV